MFIFCLFIVLPVLALCENQPFFFVYNTQSKLYKRDASLDFDSIELNNQQLFNSTTNRANIRKNGYYISAATSSTSTSQKLSLKHVGGFGGDRIDLNSTLNEGVSMTSRISIAKVNSDRDVFLSTRGNDSVTYSDGTSKALSWAMFRYETGNIFYGRYSGISSSTKVLFNDVLVLQDVGYNGETFKIMDDGIYFISISFGLEEYSRSYTIYLVFAQSILPRELGRIVFRPALESSGNHSLSRSWIVELKKNDEFFIESDYGRLAGPKLLGSLSLFKLDATVEKPAFNAYTSISWAGQNELSAIPFSNIIYQVGNYWNRVDNTYEIWTSGIYFLSLTGESGPSTKLEIEILVNKKSRGRLLSHENRDSSGSSKAHSRTILLDFNKGDVLQFLLTRNSELLNNYLVTNFALFFISAK